MLGLDVPASMLWLSSGECAELGLGNEVMKGVQVQWSAEQDAGLMLCVLEHKGVGSCGSLGMQKSDVGRLEDVKKVGVKWVPGRAPKPSSTFAHILKLCYSPSSLQ